MAITGTASNSQYLNLPLGLSQARHDSLKAKFQTQFHRYLDKTLLRCNVEPVHDCIHVMYYYYYLFCTLGRPTIKHNKSKN